jgi:hypothetical protein
VTADLVILRESTLRDVPATLRQIADRIDAGEYGKARSCVLVLRADAVEVMYMGDGEPGPSAHLLLHAGAAQVVEKFTRGRP